MKRQTLFLKMAVVLLSAPAIVFCIVLLPAIAVDAIGHPKAVWLYIAVAALYAAVIPYGIALFQAFRLLRIIDRNDAFTESSVTALKRIKYCAAVVGVLFCTTLPIFYFVADADDAPGLMVIGLAFAFAPFVISVFAAVLETLLRNAIDIKSENDLTV